MPCLPHALHCPVVRAFGCLLLLTFGVSPLTAAGPSRPAEARVTAPPNDGRTAQQREHLARLGADRWHAAGYRGRGVKIAVLDTGWRGYRAFLGKALPAHVTVHSFRADGNLEAKDSQHGILCAEILHTLAPEAELLLANWDLDRPDEFLAAARWARQQGARVISCSVVAPSWSNGDGGGTVHQELAHILGPGGAPGDLLCFASAGNTIERHWGGKFHDAGDGFHEWAPGRKDNPLTPWGAEPVAAELYGYPGTDYDLSVQDSATGAEVGHSATTRDGASRTSAVIRFRPEEGHTYRVRVRRTRGPVGAFHVCTGNGSLDYTTARASVCFPADGPEVLAMGAVDREGHRLSYSACGPNSPQPKPDFVALIPFTTLIRDRPFAGTSAAAPQGAALAALRWSRHPEWTAGQIRAALRGSARDLNTPGHDWETGYGLICLPRQ